MQAFGQPGRFYFYLLWTLMVSDIVKNNFLFYFTRLGLGLVFDILYFPVWWYTRGAVMILRRLGNMIAGEEKSLALMVWIKNIFRPMYGVRGWDGYLISFLVRFFQIIIRSIALIAAVAIALALFVLWLTLPLIAIGQVFYQLG
ncbi:MAG: hypothetical protein WCW25_02320 [Patescibacteria group bacterium]|jgi:hypothetical protein